jgi:hypothetical protein
MGIVSTRTFAVPFDEHTTDHESPESARHEPRHGDSFPGLDVVNHGALALGAHYPNKRNEEQKAFSVNMQRSSSEQSFSTASHPMS